jgi:hypothetical protein
MMRYKNVSGRDVFQSSSPNYFLVACSSAENVSNPGPRRKVTKESTLHTISRDSWKERRCFWFNHADDHSRKNDESCVCSPTKVVRVGAQKPRPDRRLGPSEDGTPKLSENLPSFLLRCTVEHIEQGLNEASISIFAMLPIGLRMQH